MANLILHQLNTLKEVEVCDQLFRDYMRWLIEELYVTHQLHITPQQEESLHEDFREEWPTMLEGKGGIYLATLDGIPSGVCALKPVSDEEVELKRFYVAPSTRGNGMGRLLLEHALDAARQFGYKQVRLETFDFMKSAVKMYKSYGFEEVPAFDGFEGTKHGTGGVELFMQLDLR
jgi:GNAT superfamily N-acetyltransferase